MSSTDLSGASNIDKTSEDMNAQDVDVILIMDEETVDLDTGETLSDVVGEPTGGLSAAETRVPGMLGEYAPMVPAAPTSGFKWWYVPAAALPVAAGATAAVILLRRRQRNNVPPLATVYGSVAKQGRDLLDSVRATDRTKKATKTVQQTIATVRDGAKSLPDQASSLRDRSAEVLSALDLAALAERAGDVWEDTRSTVGNVWERRGSAFKPVSKTLTGGKATQVAKDAAKSALRNGTYATKAGKELAKQQASDSRVRQQIAQMRARAQALQTQQQAKQAQQAIAAARARAAGAANQAVTPVLTAARATSARTTAVAQQTRKGVSSAWRRTTTFTFAMVISAMVTYVRAWRQRLMEREMRESAGGRLVRDA